MEQFARSAALLGEEALSRLQHSRVAVFGIGGVGGFAAEALVRSGVGAIDLIDCDRVSLTNLNRQIIALHSTLGQPKVEAMAARLKDIAPSVRVTPHEMLYLPANADAFDLSPFDFVLDAVDNLAAKEELAFRCQERSLPLISAMGAGNKLDPSLLRVSDISQTQNCPLARAMRQKCRKRGIRRLTVAWSPELPVRPRTPLTDAEGVRKDVPASMMFVPAAMGLLMASHVVRTLLGAAT